MAKTKIAPPLAGIRGTVGGLTFSANKSGTYVKLWAPPSNPQTAPQSIERSYLAQMSNLWRALTAGQRTAWDTFAALGAQEQTDSLGEPYYLSGWLWFVKCNIRLLRVGRATISAAPVIARPAAPTITAARITIAGTDPTVFTGGTPLASTTAPGFPASNAFDGNVATDWRTLPPNTGGTINYQLPAGKSIIRYRLYFPSIAAGTMLPKNGVLQGRTPGAWTIFDTQADWLPAQIGWSDIWIPQSTVNSEYRCNIFGNQGHPTQLAVFEFQAFQGAVGSSFIEYPSAEFSTGPWDLILHISMTNSTAKAVQYPGYYEVLATQTPGDIITTFQTQLQTVFGTILPERRWFIRLFRQTTEGLRSAAATTAVDTF